MAMGEDFPLFFAFSFSLFPSLRLASSFLFFFFFPSLRRCHDYFIAKNDRKSWSGFGIIYFISYFFYCCIVANGFVFIWLLDKIMYLAYRILKLFNPSPPFFNFILIFFLYNVITALSSHWWFRLCVIEDFLDRRWMAIDPWHHEPMGVVKDVVAAETTRAIDQ